jgi:hypothetical protein
MVGRPVAAALLSLLAALHPGLEGPVTSFVQVRVAALSQSVHIRHRGILCADAEQMQLSFQQCGSQAT